MAFIAVMLVLTGLGVGFGGLFGLQLVGRMEKAADGEKPPQQAAAPSAGPASKAAMPATSACGHCRRSSPTLPAPARPGSASRRSSSWTSRRPDAGTLSAQIAEDIVAFLRTVSLTQIEGASGFQHLREDLNDRVRVRSGGKVRDLVVQSMIIE